MIITGTGTEVGKTITTAAIAACARAQGKKVAVVKPVQTGVGPSDPGDLSEMNRLTGIDDLHECARFADPLAPATAARRAGVEAPSAAELAANVLTLANRDLVLVEGAGGALVRLNQRGETLLDLAAHIGDADIVLVTSAGLGSLHAAAASAQAITAKGLPLSHLVVGDWPDDPGLAERENLADLPDYTGVPIAGVIAHGAGRLDRTAFAALAIGSLTRALGGRLDVAEFTASHTRATRAVADQPGGDA